MYEIVRFYHPSQNRENEVIKSGLSLEEAKEHCQDEDSKEDGIYFDGFREE